MPEIPLTIEASNAIKELKRLSSEMEKIKSFTKAQKDLLKAYDKEHRNLLHNQKKEIEGYRDLEYAIDRNTKKRERYRYELKKVTADERIFEKQTSSSAKAIEAATRAFIEYKTGIKSQFTAIGSGLGGNLPATIGVTSPAMIGSSLPAIKSDMGVGEFNPSGLKEYFKYLGSIEDLHSGIIDRGYLKLKDSTALYGDVLDTKSIDTTNIVNYDNGIKGLVDSFFYLRAAKSRAVSDINDIDSGLKKLNRTFIYSGKLYDKVRDNTPLKLFIGKFASTINKPQKSTFDKVKEKVGGFGKVTEEEADAMNASREAMYRKIRTFKFYLGLVMMLVNFGKKILGNTQILGKAVGLLGSAFGFIIDMVFLPFIPIIIEVVKWLFGVGNMVKKALQWLAGIHPWLDKIASGFIIIVGILTMSWMTGVVGFLNTVLTLLSGTAGVAGVLATIKGLLIGFAAWIAPYLVGSALGLGLAAIVIYLLEISGILDMISDASSWWRDEHKETVDSIIANNDLLANSLNLVADIYNATIGNITGNKILTGEVRDDILSGGMYSEELLHQLQTRDPTIEYYNQSQWNEAGYYRGNPAAGGTRITDYSQVSTYNYTTNNNSPNRSASPNLQRYV